MGSPIGGVALSSGSLFMVVRCTWWSSCRVGCILKKEGNSLSRSACVCLSVFLCVYSTLGEASPD